MFKIPINFLELSVKDVLSLISKDGVNDILLSLLYNAAKWLINFNLSVYFWSYLNCYVFCPNIFIKYCPFSARTKYFLYLLKILFLISFVILFG